MTRLLKFGFLILVLLLLPFLHATQTTSQTGPKYVTITSSPIRVDNKLAYFDFKRNDGLVTENFPKYIMNLRVENRDCSGGKVNVFSGSWKSLYANLNVTSALADDGYGLIAGSLANTYLKQPDLEKLRALIAGDFRSLSESYKQLAYEECAYIKTLKDGGKYADAIFTKDDGENCGLYKFSSWTATNKHYQQIKDGYSKQKITDATTRLTALMKPEKLSPYYECINGKTERVVLENWIATLNGPYKTAANAPKTSTPTADTASTQSKESVVVSFDITPKGAETYTPSALSKTVPGADDFTLKYLVFAKAGQWKGFEYTIKFSEKSNVQSYEIYTSKIASYDLKLIKQTPIRVAQENPIAKGGGIAVGSIGLEEGVWKIYVTATKKDGTKITTYWQPEHSKDLLDGVIVIAPSSIYQNKKDYEDKTELTRLKLMYPQKDEKTLNEIQKLVKDIRSFREKTDKNLERISLSKSTNEIEANARNLIINRDALAAKTIEIITKVNGKDSEKTKDATAAINQDVWLEKLITYLSMEKRLTDAQAGICAKSGLDKSLLSFQNMIYVKYISGLEDAAGCNKGIDNDLVFQKTYIDYMLQNLITYKKIKTSSAPENLKTLPDLNSVITNLRNNFKTYLQNNIVRADGVLSNLDDAYSLRVIKNGEERTLLVPASISWVSKLEGSEMGDGLTAVKINDKTCTEVLLVTTTGGESSDFYQGTGSHVDYTLDKTDGRTVKYITLNSETYSDLARFCQQFTTKATMKKVLDHQDVKKNQAQETYLTASEVLPARPGFDARQMDSERNILYNLADRAFKLEDEETYQQAILLAKNSGGIREIDTTHNFNFDKCIAPYTTPGFVLNIAGFVAMAALTEGIGGAALIGGAGDAMMVTGAWQLATDKSLDVNRLKCDFVATSFGVATGYTVGKLRAGVNEWTEARAAAKLKKAGEKATDDPVKVAEAIVAEKQKAVALESSGTELVKQTISETGLSTAEAGQPIVCRNPCGTAEVQDYANSPKFVTVPIGVFTLNLGLLEGRSGEFYLNLMDGLPVITKIQTPQTIGKITFYGHIQSTTFEPYSTMELQHTNGKWATINPKETWSLQAAKKLIFGTTEIYIKLPNMLKYRIKYLKNAATRETAAWGITTTEGATKSVAFGEPVEIGRRIESTIMLRDKTISRTHGRIVALEDGTLAYYEYLGVVRNPSTMIFSDGSEHPMPLEGVSLSSGIKVKLVDGTVIDYNGITQDGKMTYKFNKRLLNADYEGTRNTVHYDASEESRYTQPAEEEVVVQKEQPVKKEPKEIFYRPARTGTQEIAFVKEATAILKKAKNRDGNIVRLITGKGEVIFFGDLHGQSSSLAEMLAETRAIERLNNGENVFLVFLGDIVDRAMSKEEQFEVLNTVLSLVKAQPNRVVLLRGNHESPAQTNYYGFDKKMVRDENNQPKRDEHLNIITEPGIAREMFGSDADAVLAAYYELFDALPIGVVTDNGQIQTLAVHGFIPYNELFAPGDKIAQMAKAKADSPIVEEMQWNDATTEEKSRINYERENKGHRISAEETDAFMKENGITYLFHGHETAPGFKDDYGNNRAWTLFSNNKAYSKGGGKGYAVLHGDGSLTVENIGGTAKTVHAKPYEKPKSTSKEQTTTPKAETTTPKAGFNGDWEAQSTLADDYAQDIIYLKHYFKMESSTSDPQVRYIGTESEIPQIKSAFKKMYRKYYVDILSDNLQKADGEKITIELNALTKARDHASESWPFKKKTD